MRSSVLVAGLALAACSSGGVSDLSLESGPIAIVRGHVDVSKLGARAAGKPLLVGLVWGKLPLFNAFCFDSPVDPVVLPTCTDAYGFSPGTVDATATFSVDSDGSFALPLMHLPSANAVIGTDVDHVAYASLVLVADVDGNGAINIQPQRARRGDGEGGPQQPPEPPPPSDVPLAASFANLLAPQQRISFREGDFFTALEYFYPAPACLAPPVGFSVLRMSPYKSAFEACDVAGLEQPVELAPLTEAESLAFACRSVRSNFRVRQPELDKPPNALGKLAEAHCIGPDVLVAASKDTCPELTAVALVGCATDAKCAKPEWDMRAAPPEWWPCVP